MTCRECDGKGVIERPMRQLKDIVNKQVLTDVGWAWETVEQVVKIGGIDACPVCAAAAEAEWLDRK